MNIINVVKTLRNCQAVLKQHGDGKDLLLERNVSNLLTLDKQEPDDALPQSQINEQIRKFQKCLDVMLIQDIGAPVKLEEEQEEAPVPRERKTIMLKPNQKQIAKVYREEVRNYLNSKSSDVL